MTAQALSPLKSRRKKTWVLIADGARARFFSAQPPSLEPALDIDLINNRRPTPQTIRDRPGRGFETDHISKQAFEPRSDWHTYQKQMFAREICQVLIRAHEEGEFQSLIIISPPKILGNLRKTLPPSISEKVKTEIAKNVTKMNDEDIAAYLNELVIL